MNDDKLLNNLLTLKDQVSQISETQIKQAEKLSVNKYPLKYTQTTTNNVLKFFISNKYFTFGLCLCLFSLILELYFQPFYVTKTVNIEGSDVFTKKIIIPTRIIISKLVLILILVGVYFFLKLNKKET